MPRDSPLFVFEILSSQWRFGVLEMIMAFRSLVLKFRQRLPLQQDSSPASVVSKFRVRGREEECEPRNDGSWLISDESLPSSTNGMSAEYIANSSLCKIGLLASIPGTKALVYAT